MKERSSSLTLRELSLSHLLLWLRAGPGASEILFEGFNSGFLLSTLGELSSILNQVVGRSQRIWDYAETLICKELPQGFGQLGALCLRAQISLTVVLVATPQP